MGAGKSTVLAEASDILATHQIPHAKIDLDALGGVYLPTGVEDNAAMYENLASISQNDARLGLTRFLVARAVESRIELDRCCQAVGATQTVVCRLIANDETMRARVAERERGMLRQDFIERETILNETLDRASLEDFSIATENIAVTDVAREVLIRARWISG
jgi:hypothetical protein